MVPTVNITGILRQEKSCGLDLLKKEFMEEVDREVCIGFGRAV